MTELHKIAYIEEWKGHYGQNILAGILMALAITSRYCFFFYSTY